MSDIAKVYPNGQEKALGNQSGGQPYPNGQEKAHPGNANLGRDYKDDRTRLSRATVDV
jgi:hypothetical protein